MELDRDVSSEQRKVPVRRQNRHAVSVRDRTKQEVCVRPLDTARAAQIEILGRAFVIGGPDRQIGKFSEMIAKTFELCRLPNPGEHLLANRTDEMRPRLVDELPELPDGGVLGEVTSAGNATIHTRRSARDQTLVSTSTVHPRLRCARSRAQHEKYRGMKH